MSYKDLPMWSSYWQSEQNSTLHFGKEHWTLGKFCKFWQEPSVVNFSPNSGQGRPCWGWCKGGSAPGSRQMSGCKPCNKQLWTDFRRWQDGSTGRISVSLPFAGGCKDVSTSCNTMQGETSREHRKTQAFSRLNHLQAKKLSNLSLRYLAMLRDRFHN